MWRHWILSHVLVCQAILASEAPVTPVKTTAIFNGKDFSGLYTWLRATGPKDPQKVFAVRDGTIHMKGGEHRGCVTTQKALQGLSRVRGIQVGRANQWR
jgi:hypothetical protein